MEFLSPDLSKFGLQLKAGQALKIIAGRAHSNEATRSNYSLKNEPFLKVTHN